MLVREAWAKYHSPVDYGITGLDLPKVAALIAAGMPTRLYYTSYRNNAFDTHVYQNDTHKRLLTYASDAVTAFLADLERIGRADDVVVMIFSEFGRRVPENVNLGTDHGAANLMFVAGKQVKGGQYGAIPSLTKLDPGDNLDLHHRFPPGVRDHDRRLAGTPRHAPVAERRFRDVQDVSADDVMNAPSSRGVRNDPEHVPLLAQGFSRRRLPGEEQDPRRASDLTAASFNALRRRA